MAAQTITVGPLTRIEGHLDIQVTADTVGNQLQVLSAQCSGTMFRGFENILVTRDARDAIQLTQRICGVCPISHALASAMTVESAFQVAPTNNGRILRNLVLGANYLQSHILHFYHLAAPDYIDTTTVSAVNMPPWTPRFSTPDMITGATAQTLVGHYLTALTMRRQAHHMGAIFGGKLPMTPSFVAGGCTNPVTSSNVSQFRSLLTGLRNFITGTMIPDAQALAAAFPAYSQLGRGCGNLLAYGVFDQGAAGLLLRSGRYTDAAAGTVSPDAITEYVKYSYYTKNNGAINPSVGLTTPSRAKKGAYSWLKAPRYLNKAHETGPLARMWVNGDYQAGISALDRIMARVLEAQKIANAMDGWLNDLAVGGPTVTAFAMPTTGKTTSVGLTEAPRGALGHWMQTTNGKITRYQVVTPTAWNASPKDDLELSGPIEQALVGTPIADVSQPVELLRVVHSFDPCLACSVHMIRPGQKAGTVVYAG